MIHEYRTYTMHPGQLARYIELAETKVRTIRKDDHGRLLGFWHAESGTLSQVHSLWEHDSLNQRQVDRASLLARSDWMAEFIGPAWPTMQKQEIHLLNIVQPFVVTSGQVVYETRFYRTVVGHVKETVTAVGRRPINEAAIRVGLWTCEAPEPNQVCEIVAYRTLEGRLADGIQQPAQQAWLEENGSHFLRTVSTLLTPLRISPSN